MQHDSNPGPSPQTQDPGPKSAAEETSQPVKAAPRTDAFFQETLCWLYGFVAGHADADVRKTASRQIQHLEDYLIYRREEVAERRAELDPRVTWSADYQLVEKLDTQLETLRAEIAAIGFDARQSGEASLEIQRRLSLAISNLEAAIKTCNTLGLPF